MGLDDIFTGAAKSADEGASATTSGGTKWDDIRADSKTMTQGKDGTFTTDKVADAKRSARSTIGGSGLGAKLSAAAASPLFWETLFLVALIALSFYAEE